MRERNIKHLLLYACCVLVHQILCPTEAANTVRQLQQSRVDKNNSGEPLTTTINDIKFKVLHDQVESLQSELRNDYAADSTNVKHLRHEMYELRQVEKMLLNEASQLDQRMQQLEKQTAVSLQHPTLSSNSQSRAERLKSNPQHSSTPKFNSTLWPIIKPINWTRRPIELMFWPKDCEDAVRRNRSLARHTLFVAIIKPMQAQYHFSVLCYQTPVGETWTVIQRRFSGMEDFSSRTWYNYETGFGSIEKDFWLGNLFTHWITYQGHYQLRILLTDVNNTVYRASYNNFWLASSGDQYRLHVRDYTKQTLEALHEALDAGDSLTSHSGARFSTWDRDQDGCIELNCAKHYTGAWWMRGCGCYAANLNARYYPASLGYNSYNRWDAMHWNTLEMGSPIRESWMIVKEKTMIMHNS